MYKFKRRVYVGSRSMDFWFGLTSKSRDRHYNFTLYLLPGGPDTPHSHAERLRAGIHSKSEAEWVAVHHARALFQDLLVRAREHRTNPPANESTDL
jgi:hypothetical protein